MSSTQGSDMTKRLMVQTLKKLMAKKPLAKISVKEITEESGVKRQTFYYHFEDIYDMLRWMYQEEAVKFVSEYEGPLLWQDGILKLFRYIEESREISLNTLNSLGHRYLKRFFYNDVHAAVEKTFESVAGDKAEIPEKYKKFLIHYFSISMAALIESWLLGDIDLKPEEIIKYIDTILKDQINGGMLRIERNPRYQDNIIT